MRPITKTDLSKLAGVSQAAVSKAVREGRVIALPDGTIDADSLGCVAYIRAKTEQKQRKGKKKSPAKPKPGAKKPPRQAPSQPPHLDDLDEEQINSAMSKLTLERRKLAAQAQQLELKNAQIEGRLVSRDAMRRCVWNPLETFLVRLLTDGSKTITSTAYALIRSGLEAEARGEKGVPREQVEVAVRGELSSLAKPLKRDIKKALFEDVQH